MAKKSAKQPTVITLTLPESEGDTRYGTLLIQRGDLAHVRQFTYSSLTDLTAVIKFGVISLTAVEAEPPVIAELPPPAPAPASIKKSAPPTPTEPTVDIPLKKGKKTVKISHLKLIGGETDAAAYREAVLIAAKFIDGKLWDGESPIRIADVYALAKKTKHLTAQDMTLFSLEDFAQVGAVEAVQGADNAADETDPLSVTDEESSDETLMPLEALDAPMLAANRHHRLNDTSDQTALL